MPSDSLAKSQVVPRVEAIHIVALAIDAARKRGTPAYKKAESLRKAAVDEWRRKLWEKKTCPNCGHKL